MAEGLDRRNAIRLLAVGPVLAMSLRNLKLADGEPSSRTDALEDVNSTVAIGRVTSADAQQVTVTTAMYSVTATPVAGARMYSGVIGLTTSPSDFVIGDRVFVQGRRRQGGAVAATRIGTVYEPIEFTVLSVTRDGKMAETTVGAVDLSGALPDVGTIDHYLRPGLTVRALSWTDPRTQARYILLTDQDRLS